MIILIGGSSHVGKTYVSQKLMERLSIPYVSIDHLKMGFVRTGMTDITTEEDYEMMVFIWPYIAEIIKTAIENDQNLILEGCYVPKYWRDSFTDEYLSHIHTFFITMSEEYIRTNIDAIASCASVIENRLCDDPDLERLVICSKEKKEDAIASGAHLIEITDSFDIDSMADTIISLAVE